MIDVALAANRTYFIGLAATLVSLLQSNRHNVFRIHIIDGGLSPQQRDFLSQRIRRHNPTNTITFHVIDAQLFHGFRVDYGSSYMSYARILLPSLVDGERVVYLDSDLLVAADIRPLWELSLDGYVVAASQDAGIKWLRNDYPFDLPCADEKYFNSGVMVMNLNLWRRLDLQDKLLRLISEAPQRFQWWDQTAMNAAFRGQVLFMDGNWNCVADSVHLEPSLAPIIFHYVGANKPWTKYSDSANFLLWTSFYDRFIRRQIWLCLNQPFLVSLLRHARHRAICGSSVLQRLAFGVHYLKEIASGRRSSFADFARRYTAGARSAKDRTSTLAVVNSFIDEKWGGR